MRCIPFLHSKYTNLRTSPLLPRSLCHPQTRLVSNDKFPASSGSSGSGRDATVGGSTLNPESGGDGDSEGKGEIDLGREGMPLGFRTSRGVGLRNELLGTVGVKVG